MKPKLLRVEGLSKSFGGVRALDDVGFDLESGQILGLIGPNGAGKTTLFNCLTGVFEPDAGRVYLTRGQKSLSIVGRRADQIAAAGIRRTFQNIRLFAGMSVLEHVTLGAYSSAGYGFWKTLMRGRSYRECERKTFDQALQLLEEVGLHPWAMCPAVDLPFGLQRRLEIARALAAQPYILLLDEPAAGLNPVEKQQLLTLIQSIRGKGVSILLIEHDMKVVMPVSDWVVVLDHGKVIAQDKPQQIQDSPLVIEAYLGKT